MLCVLQRALTRDDDIPESLRGRLRAVDVWIGAAGSSSADADFVPPPPDKLEDLTREWCEWWTNLHPQVKGGSRAYVIMSLAEFHHRLVAIHPFVDGNGRLACFLLDQAARELLSQGLDKGFVQPPQDYYSALAAADRGDLNALAERISAALN
jgi:fido (protein-threonine AMPylation protein)